MAPRLEGEARAAPGTRPVWIACRHLPLAHQGPANDLWLVPVLLSERAWQMSAGFAQEERKNVAVTFGGSRAVFAGYDPAYVAVEFLEPQGPPDWTLKDLVTNRGLPYLPGTVLALLLEEQRLYSYQDTSQSLSAAQGAEMGGCRPFSYWQARDAHLYVDFCRLDLRYRVEEMTWRDLKRLGSLGTTSLLSLQAPSDRGFAAIQDILSRQATRLVNIGYPLFNQAGDPELPLGSVIAQPRDVRLETLQHLLDAIFRLASPDELLEIDGTPPRRKALGPGVRFPVGWPREVMKYVPEPEGDIPGKEYEADL